MIFNKLVIDINKTKRIDMSHYQLNNQWEDVLKTIQENLSPQIFNTWFSGVKYIDFKNNELILAVPNLFCKNWLEKNYYQFLKDILVDQMGLDDNILIKFHIDSVKNQGELKIKKIKLTMMTYKKNITKLV